MIGDGRTPEEAAEQAILEVDRMAPRIKSESAVSWLEYWRSESPGNRSWELHSDCVDRRCYCCLTVSGRDYAAVGDTLADAVESAVALARAAEQALIEIETRQKER